MAARHNVQRMREAMGLSHEDFADKLGVHERTVRRWEAREVDPSPMALSLLRRVWGTHQRDTALATTTAPDDTPDTNTRNPTSPAEPAPSPRRLALTAASDAQ